MNDTLALTPVTISIYTRHSDHCLKKADKNWRRCKCRKWLYIFENGEGRRVSAGTRSWEQAEEVAQAERERYDPVKRKLQEIKDQEAQKAALVKAKNITVSEATKRWLQSLKVENQDTFDAYRRAAKRINEWSEHEKVKNLTDVTADMLDKWRGEWGEKAEMKFNRIGRSSQSHFLGYLKRFFRYALRIGRIEATPALELKPITKSKKRTQVLSPEQFQAILAAVPRYCDAQGGIVHEFAAEFRALFLLQRWSGMRILDCLVLPRTALNGCNLKTVTIKNGGLVDSEMPPEVVGALQALFPERELFLPGYFLWNRKTNGSREAIKRRTLSTKWGNFIKALNGYLDLRDTQGKPMRFHSHMLRDTFAVELLMAGVPIEDVSRLLTHTSIKTTEEYYGHWVEDRLKRLKQRAANAMEVMRAKSPEYFGSTAFTT